MNFSTFKSVFLYALRDVSRSKLIFFLTTVSLSIIFTAIFLTGGILEGFGNSLSNAQTDINGELVIVPKGDDFEIEEAGRIESELENIENIESFSPRNSGFCILEYKDKKIGPQFTIGVDVEKETKTSLLKEKTREGRFLANDDVKKVVLGDTIADALVDLEYDGKKIPIGEKITLTSSSGNRWEYEVVGILDAKNFYTNWATIMIEDESELFNNSNDPGIVVIKLKDAEKMIETKKEIEQKISFAEVQTWKQQAGFVYDIILVFGLMTGSIIGLLAASVFMVTSVILYINFLQYRRQIGILKAMGTSNSFIVLVYMVEAFIFATLSFGIAFAIFVVININSNKNPIPLMIGDFHTALNLNNIFLTFLTLVVASIGGSVIPALIAAKTNIVDVIRDA